jgi:hypothetical protein
MTAKQIANALGDEKNLALYDAYLNRYFNEAILKTYNQVLQTPRHRIKKSPGAYFTFMGLPEETLRSWLGHLKKWHYVDVEKHEPSYQTSFETLCRLYPQNIIQKALMETKEVPSEKIKKSRGALFVYLVKKYGLFMQQSPFSEFFQSFNNAFSNK